MISSASLKLILLCIELRKIGVFIFSTCKVILKCTCYSYVMALPIDEAPSSALILLGWSAALSSFILVRDSTSYCALWFLMSYQPVLHMNSCSCAHPHYRDTTRIPPACARSSHRSLNILMAYKPIGLYLSSQ